MPSISRDDLRQKSFKIKPDDDRLFSKLLSRESAAKSSFRVYYGGVPGAVPFVWETRPGTPKHNSAGNYEIPPLTPPPSYYSAGNGRSCGGASRSKLLLHSLLRRLNPNPNSRRGGGGAVSHSSSSSLSSMSWSSSSQSSLSDPLSTPPYVRRRRRFTSWGSIPSFDGRGAAAEEDDHLRRGGGICFRFGIGGGRSVKRALLSIVGRGSAA